MIFRSKKVSKSYCKGKKRKRSYLSIEFVVFVWYFAASQCSPAIGTSTRSFSFSFGTSAVSRSFSTQWVHLSNLYAFTFYSRLFKYFPLIRQFILYTALRFKATRSQDSAKSGASLDLTRLHFEHFHLMSPCLMTTVYYCLLTATTCRPIQRGSQLEFPFRLPALRKKR